MPMIPPHCLLNALNKFILEANIAGMRADSDDIAIENNTINAPICIPTGSSPIP